MSTAVRTSSPSRQGHLVRRRWAPQTRCRPRRVPRDPTRQFCRIRDRGSPDQADESDWAVTGRPVRTAAATKATATRTMLIGICIFDFSANRQHTPNQICLEGSRTLAPYSVSSQHRGASAPSTVERQLPAPWSVSSQHRGASVPSTLQRQFQFRISVWRDTRSSTAFV